MTMSKPRPAIALLAAAGALTAAAQTDPATSELEEVRQRGRLVMICFPHQDSEFVSVNLAAGPMARVGDTSSFVGADVDLMAEFAAELGVELEIRPVAEPSYGALIPALLGGDGDLVASSLTITEERRRQVDFSVPYHVVHPVVVTRRDGGPASVDELQGRTAAAIPSSSQEQLLRGLGFGGDRLVPVSFTRDGLLAVAEGQADLVLVDSGVAGRLLPEFPGLVAAFGLPGEEGYGFAVRPGSNLLPALDAFLAGLSSSGRLAEIKQRHRIPTD